MFFMTKGKGKHKGSSFERQFCKKISLWWTKGERDDIFWRTSISGGRATVRAKQGKTTKGQYGDVAATDPLGVPLTELCVIELKCGYGKSSVGDYMDGTSKSMIERWVEQVNEDAKKGDIPFWFLVTKRDRKKVLISMPFLLVDKLLGEVRTEPVEMVHYWKDIVFSTFRLDDFLVVVSSEDIKNVE